MFETAPPGVFDGLKAIPLHCSGYKLLIATDMCCDWNSFSFAETLRWALPASPESPEKNDRKHHWFWDFERKQTHSVYSMFYTTITVMRSGQANIWRHHQLHLDLGGITSKLAASNLQTGCFWHFHAFSTIIHQHDFPSYLIKTIIYSAIAVTLWQNLWQNARYCVFNPSNSWQLGCVFSKVDNKKQNETTKENQPEKCVRSEPHHSRTPLSGTLQFQRLETHRAADHQAFRATCWPQFILRDGHLGKRNAQSLWLPAIPATPAVWVFVVSAIRWSQLHKPWRSGKFISWIMMESKKIWIDKYSKYMLKQNH